MLYKFKNNRVKIYKPGKNIAYVMFVIWLFYIKVSEIGIQIIKYYLKNMEKTLLRRGFRHPFLDSPYRKTNPLKIIGQSKNVNVNYSSSPCVLHMTPYIKSSQNSKNFIESIQYHDHLLIKVSDKNLFVVVQFLSRYGFL